MKKRITLSSLALMVFVAITYGETTNTNQTKAQPTGDELDKILAEVSSDAEAKPVKRAAPAAEEEPLPPVVGPTNSVPSPAPTGSVILEDAKPEQTNAATLPKITNAPSPITMPDEEGKVTSGQGSNELPAGIEETRIYTMRNIKLRKAGNSEWEPARIPVPVYYRSKSIAWGQEELRQAFALQQRINSYTEKLEMLKKEGAMLLEEYNKLIIAGIPEEVLGNDSPSIPEGIREENLAQPLRGKDLKIEVKQETPQS